MKEEFRSELITSLLPYVKEDSLNDVKMKIDIILNDYDINKIVRSLKVYEGNKNVQMIQRFVMSKIARGLSKRSVSYYQNTLNSFFHKMKSNYDEITADDIRMYLAIRVQIDGVTKVTANNERRCLSSFYNWLAKEEILLKNPMNKVESIKIQKQKKQAFDQMEIEKLRLHCQTERESLLIELLLSTWARVSEVANIKLAEIKGNEVLVHGKGGKDRIVYLNARALLHLDLYLQERKDTNPYLFPKAKFAGSMISNYYTEVKKRKPRKELKKWYQDPELVHETEHCDSSTIENIVRHIGEKAKVESVHPHRFRRTGATNALRSGMPLITVSKLLGHENIGTTQIYLDITDKELETAHEKYVV